MFSFLAKQLSDNLIDKYHSLHCSWKIIDFESYSNSNFWRERDNDIVTLFYTKYRNNVTCITVFFNKSCYIFVYHSYIKRYNISFYIMIHYFIFYGSTEIAELSHYYLTQFLLDVLPFIKW